MQRLVGQESSVFFRNTMRSYWKVLRDVGAVGEGQALRTDDSNHGGEQGKEPREEGSLGRLFQPGALRVIPQRCPGSCPPKTILLEWRDSTSQSLGGWMCGLVTKLQPVKCERKGKGATRRVLLKTRQHLSCSLFCFSAGQQWGEGSFEGVRATICLGS